MRAVVCQGWVSAGTTRPALAIASRAGISANDLSNKRGCGIAGDLDGKVKVGKLDVDDSPITAGKFGVRGVPTIMVFKNGQRAAQHVGLTTKAKLLELVNG